MSNNGQDQGQADARTGEPRARPVGGTEYSWCRAVPSGTGITVLALLLSKPPDISLLQNALHLLQISHPILRSKLRFDATGAAFSFLTPPSPHLRIQLFDLPSTSVILSNNPNPSLISPHHFIAEHEMNNNSWFSSSNSLQSESDTDDYDLLFTSVYTLSDTRWAVVLRLHTGACDRASAAFLLRELLGLVAGNDKEMLSDNDEIGMRIEDCIPKGKAGKPFWVRGMDVIGYSLNSFRLANLNFVDAASPRCSQFVRLQMNPDQTRSVLEGCKSRGIKLCGALAAAGLIAAHSTKHLPANQSEKYAIVTLTNCRSMLDPIVTIHHLGFYHSAILNTHDVSGGDKLWEVANRCYMSFANAKNNNKHFSDMGDLNFLMGKAIDNPGLTPSSSARTAFLSVFEDPVMDDTTPMHGELGVEDYVGCASVHGIGPSVALFDTIRDGQLDCACVYPSPLHSREQMQKLVDDMKRILVDCCVNDEWKS